MLAARVTVYPPYAPPPKRDAPASPAPVLAPPERVDPDARRLPPPAGFPVPDNDGEMRLVYEKLAVEDDKTIRCVLIDIGRGHGNEMMYDWVWKWSHRRVTLTDEFGARVLRLATPLLDLDAKSPVAGQAGPDEVRILLPMLLRLLEAMQYEPALEVLMRTEGFAWFRSEGIDWSRCLVWSAFGRAAIGPLVDLAHSADRRDPTGQTRRKPALDALGLVRDEDAIPGLQRLLADLDSDVRTAAAGALREMGASTEVEHR